MEDFCVIDVSLGSEIMSKGKKPPKTQKRKLLKHVAISGPEYVNKL